jgi:hypothetical protein
MSFKSGLIVGAGIGYVLGAKAGRQRYEDIRRLWNQVSGSTTVQRATGKTMEVAGESARKGLSLVQQGVEKAGSAVKSRLHHEDVVDQQAERLIDLVEDGGDPYAQPRTAGEAFGDDTARTDYSK